MPQYRIKKGDRVYACKKLAIVQTLITRGFVQGGDSVSRDGGPWLRAEDVDEFGALIALSRDIVPPAGDAWSQVDPADFSDQPADRLLDEFLSSVASGPMPSVPTPPSPPRVVGLGPRGPAGTPSLPFLPAAALEPLLPGPPPPASIAPPSPPDAPEVRSPRAHLSLVPPEVESAAVPSFGTWMAAGEDGEGKRLLRSLGGSDVPELLVRPPSVPRVRWGRAAAIAGTGLLTILGVHTWIKTGATTPYPMEGQLVAEHRRAAGFATPGEGSPAIVPVDSPPTRSTRAETPWSIDGAAASTPQANDDQARQNALRQRVSSRVEAIQDSPHLEDVLFMELQNLGCAPRRVTVHAIRSLQAASGREGKPVMIDLDVELDAVEPGEGVGGRVAERFTLLLFVAGKYAHQGGIGVGRLTASLRAPTPVSQAFDGRNLAALWTGRAMASEFFQDK